MTGDHLHQYDLELCDYLVGNVAQHMDRLAFNADLETVLTSRLLLDYLKQAQCDALDRDEKRLLLNDDELYRLELTFDGDLNRFWVSSEPVHRRHIETLPEVRDHLSRQTAEEWSEVCAKFARQLEDRHTRLSEGIAVIREWVGRLRTLLRVMGAATLLPAPEGGLPTPTCSRPSSAPAELIVQNSQPGHDTLAATITEIRDLIVDQRCVKELYTTAEAAEILRRAEYTVREWCRKGQVPAKKASNGRSWLITHAELTRLRNHGPLPEDQLHCRLDR